MKEAYETLKMEIIAFDGEIFTDDDGTGVPTDIIRVSGTPYQQPA